MVSLPRIAPLAGVVAFLAGCSQAPTPPATTLLPDATFDVLVTPANLTLRAGESGQLSAQANDASGQPIGGALLRYSAADPKVLKTSDRGLVTALGPASPQTYVIVASNRIARRVPVVVQPGPPQHIAKMAGDGQTIHAGDAPPPLSVRVMDYWGNPIAELPVSVEATAAATAVESSDAKTGPDGTVQLSLPPLTRAGSVEVTVHPRGSDAPSESFALHVAAASPARLSLVANPHADTPSGAAPDKPGVLVTDSYGNPISGAAVHARLLPSNQAPLLARTDESGIATIALPRVPPRRARLEVTLGDYPAVHESFSLEHPGK